MYVASVACIYKQYMNEIHTHTHRVITVTLVRMCRALIKNVWIGILKEKRTTPLDIITYWTGSFRHTVKLLAQDINKFLSLQQ